MQQVNMRECRADARARSLTGLKAITACNARRVLYGPPLSRRVFQREAHSAPRTPCLHRSTKPRGISQNLPAPHENICKFGSSLHSIASISVPKLQNQALAARTGAFQFSHLPAFSPTSPYSPLFLSFHSLAVR